MQDVIFVAVIVAFFALAAAYITACERIAGREVAGREVAGQEVAGDGVAGDGERADEAGSAARLERVGATPDNR